MVVSTKLMLINAMSSVAVLMAVAVTSVHASSATSSHSQHMWRMNRPRLQHPPQEHHLINIRQSLCSGETHNSLMAMLSMRGGAGTWGKSGMKHKIGHGDDGESVLECDEDCDDDCEYEYEYYEVDDDDVNEAERDEEDTATSTTAVNDDADDVHAEIQHQPENYEDAEEDDGKEAESEKTVGEEEDDYEDDDDYLFTTPISKEKTDPVPPSQKRQSVQRARSNLPKQAEKYDDDEEEETYLFETPIPTKKNSQSQPTRKANRTSKATTHWWWQNHNPMTDKRRQQRRTTSKGRQLQSRRRHVSSSRGASFIPPPFYTGSPSRSFDIRAFNGRSFYSDVLSSLTSALGFLLQPMGNAIQTITNVVTSTLSRYISLSLSLIRNTLDYMWYGPVEGVTTTGIPTRDGGLSSFLMSGPVLLFASSIVIVGLLSVVMSRRVPDGESSSSAKENDARRRFIRKNGDYDEDSPSIKDELHFLNREFDAANPTTKDRITKSIISTTNRLWPKQQRRVTNKDNRPKSRRGQRQFTIQSIQQWWKERPNQPPIAIIEPQHLRNSQQEQKPPLGKEINQLQKKLAVSEQERAILQQDVQHLLTKLQRAQELAKSASLHNKWQEKLSSRTDQILGRGNGGGDEDASRRKTKSSGIGTGEQRNNRGRNVEEGEARRDERGVIERGGIGGRNDLDIQAGPNPRILDGVTIVRDIDDMEEEMEEDGADDYYYDDGGDGDDMKWPAL
ncbi:hypothetical protein ACHAXH_002349 [Discostella pseudostelligera]